MNSKGLEMAEKIVLGNIALAEKIKMKLEYWEGVRNKQIELDTGFNSELMALWFKGKILSIVPSQWKDTAFKLLF